MLLKERDFPGLISVFFSRLRWQSIFHSCQLKAASQNQYERHACACLLTENRSRLCMSESLWAVNTFLSLSLSRFQVISAASPAEKLFLDPVLDCPCVRYWANTWSLIMGTQALLAPLCTGTCRGWWDVWLELPLSFATLQLWVLRTRRTDAVSALPASVAPSDEASAVMYALPQGRLGNEHVHGRSSGGRRAGPECTNIQLWIGFVSGKETSRLKMVLKFSCLCWTQPSLDELHFFFNGEDFVPEWNSIAALGFSLFARKKKKHNSLKRAKL